MGVLKVWDEVTLTFVPVVGLAFLPEEAEGSFIVQVRSGDWNSTGTGHNPCAMTGVVEKSADWPTPTDLNFITIPTNGTYVIGALLSAPNDNQNTVYVSRGGHVFQGGSEWMGMWGLNDGPAGSKRYLQSSRPTRCVAGEKFGIGFWDAGGVQTLPTGQLYAHRIGA